MNWTHSQKQAIESQSDDIIVTASAGTGKTSVLSHRCVHILSGSDLPPDVSDILVLTFTDAAAGEMNSRIAQRLRDKAAETKDVRLGRQLLMLDAADISTIHAFCKRTITAHFHRLGIDPAVRVMDDDESKLIKSEILKQVIEDGWQDLADRMQKLLRGRAVAGGKHNFLDCIIKISDFLDTVASRQNWFDRAIILNDAIVSASSEAVKNQKQIILDKLKTFKQQFERSLKLDAQITGCHWKEKIETDCLPVIILAIELLQKDDLKTFIELSTSFEGFKWPNKPKGLDGRIRDLILSPAKKAIEGFKELSSFAILNPEYESLVAGGCSVQTKVLLELVKRFDIAYQQEKQRFGCLDFADLEKYMLKLLSKDGDIDSGEASDVAIELQKRYKYIFVDEYQDINPVQQRIIDLLSGSAKVFVVGDVKQSIYAWRGADCGLFVQRLNDTKTDESKSRVDLNENFRSRPGILNFVNEIFSRIMTSSVAAIDYDEKAALKPFAASSESSDGKPDVEVIIVDEDRTEQQEDEDDNNDENENASGVLSDAINRRALVVADRIKKLVEVEKFKIYDKTTASWRPCRWGDIAILTRSLKERANNYVQVLRSANIPVTSDSSAGYFETTEISDMLCLLGVLDNPRQDIPLAAVLRSPIFNVTDDEFAIIKAHSEEKTDFYSLLESIADSSEDKNLRQKISDILARLDDWRTLARRGSLADLIWQIYSQTGLLSFVSALAGGAQRRANLLKLHHRAIQFENFASSSNVISLSRFVNFLQNLLESGGDWAPAEPDSSAADAVKVMSVHKSKGLEFPIVILAETNKKFGGGTHLSDCITDSQAAIGLKVIDKVSGTKQSSLVWQVIKEKQTKQSLAEEMRILYVAMTRAREKLIITGAAKSDHCASLLCNAALSDSPNLPGWLIENAKSELDWLVMALAKHKKLIEHFKPPIDIDCSEDNLFDLKVWQRQDIQQIAEQLIKSRPPSRYEQIKLPLADATLLAKINTNLTWQYPFGKTAGIRAKQSVTSIAQTVGEQFAPADYSFSFDSFDTSANINDGLVIGSATHLVMQNIDLNRIDVEKTISGLLAKGCIRKETAQRIDASSIEKFFASELGRVVLDNKNTVIREWPFTYAASAEQLYPDAEISGSEKIIVQGIIDMLVKTPDGIIIIDFKTDHINSSQLQQRAERYLPQMKWYYKAAGEILKEQVAGGYLYFLSFGSGIKVC
ncbi:MAG: helicase-exonuclease AddAB subunit AddA [Phycisphaerae bacterium]|nr:helicase-exonuclease AddAB subunit AddA [Phycisphaerae bacterium]